jgi:hypothetical protein
MCVTNYIYVYYIPTVSLYTTRLTTHVITYILLPCVCVDCTHSALHSVITLTRSLVLLYIYSGSHIVL